MPFRRYVVIDGKRWRAEDAQDPPRPVNHDGNDDEYAVVFTDEEGGEERMGYLHGHHLAQASEEQLQATFRAAE